MEAKLRIHTDGQDRVPMTMTREEVAHELQVTTKTVDNLWRSGKLPHPSRIGCGVRFLRTDVLDFIAENRA